MKIDRGDWSNGLRYTSINDIILGLVYRCWLDIISASDLLDQDSVLNALFTIYTYTQTNLNIRTKYGLIVRFQFAFTIIYLFFFSLSSRKSISSYFTHEIGNFWIPSSTRPSKLFLSNYFDQGDPLTIAIYIYTYNYLYTYI